MTVLLPVSAIVPTLNRSEVLSRMLRSLAEQRFQPKEMVIVDASEDRDTENLCSQVFQGLGTKLIYHRAVQVGAAPQRNEAMKYASQDVCLFMDDDIFLEADCVARLWKALQSDSTIGGANAMITNQKYGSPGWLSRRLFRFLHGRYERSYAGKCIGPALNLLPEDAEDMPEIVPVEWLNLGCTMYRRQSLPSPVFPSQFSGYSFMEDVALSLQVGRQWKLVNARTARIFHDSQSDECKKRRSAFARMELVNRHFVMTCILDRRGLRNYSRLLLLEVFGLVTPLVSAREWPSLPARFCGKAGAAVAILRQPRSGPGAGVVEAESSFQSS